MWDPFPNNRFVWTLLILQVVFLGTVIAAYYPNYGLAGCYLYKDNMDNYTRSKFNKTSDYNYTNDIPTNASFLYCVKECRKNNKTYAGIMTTPQRNCFCGNEYNQTFAKDLKECSIASNSYMTIYNTDFELKPLLAMPGNGSYLVNIWNSTKYKRIFIDDVMRNPAIDGWKQKLPYHKPEYVKLEALNRYGQNLWEMEFFTNTCMSADPLEWLKVDKVLYQTGLTFSVSGSKLEIKKEENENNYIFVQGGIEKTGSSITMVTKNTTPQPIFRHIKVNCLQNTDRAECNGSYGYVLLKNGNTSQNICCEKVDDQSQNATVLYKQPPGDALTYFPIGLDVGVCDCGSNHTLFVMENKTKICLENNGSNDEIILQTGRNYGMDKAALDLVEQDQMNFSGKGEYICGVNLSNCTEQNITTCLIGLTIDLENSIQLNRSKLVDVTEFPTSDYFLDSCVWATAINAWSNCSCNISFYRQKDDALAIVDRLVVLGFYHKEEPKVSKWEFLNDFPLEEVYNIMRPQLEKVRDAGSVPVRNLSSRVRTKESAPDERTSSQGIGIIGGCLLGFVILIIFISDLWIIKTHLTALFRNLFSFLDRIQTSLRPPRVQEE
uniref:Uncharacterized protein LOC111135446 isoform X1 n=1 Tax=Crassostrea virginica TaxID=6565 RepID=A0A8B8EMV8_CRAVI|nr:uncharacterized protein LOC111135446 isoform X1 [Crassostrea virginica]